MQKLLARAGVASRRRAEELVAAGRVTINGVTAELGASADPDLDALEIDGEPVALAATATYLAVHKPRGYVSSAVDERGVPSVLRLVPSTGVRLWPAGRLDVDSEGLLVLTNDGDWANRVLHPRYGIRREYAVLVSRAPDRREAAQLLAGVQLADGPARLARARPADAPREIRRSSDEAGVWLRVEVAEGRKREVRRIFGALGIEVRRLVRTRLGTLALDGLQTGEWRKLGRADTEALLRAGSGKARPR